MTDPRDDNRQPDFDWFRDLLWNGLAALAAEPDDQIAYYPPFVCIPDELALDFGHALEVCRGWDLPEVSGDWARPIDSLDQLLSEMSRGGAKFSEDLWGPPDALRSHPLWAECRRHAQDALIALAWPSGPIERSPHTYVSNEGEFDATPTASDTPD